MSVALITGASMGLGEEFARQLAARRMDLLLVARSEDRLQALATELVRKHQIKAHVLACDLSREGAPQQVLQAVTEKKLKVSWLINNAGFGLIGPLERMDANRVREMISLNVSALVELTQLMLPVLRMVGDARVINVASTAAFQPIPQFNVYAATKVFVLHFSEALSEELCGTSIRVLCLCPGPTPTQFHVAAGIDARLFNQGQTARQVVRMGILGSDKGRTVVVCQRVWTNLLIRLAPRIVVRKVAGMIGKLMVNRSMKP
ncbi:SDR family oxidoreductase [Candidatus Sumerlaeota bacterium]|nr:SDR family oxidoreductase [Candidatus Sumerlaeota bacterium]